MLKAMKEAYTRLRRGGRGLAYCAVMATMAAGPAVAQSSAPMSMLPIDGYHMVRNGMEIGDKPSITLMFYFFVGLRQSLMALDDAYVAAGAKRRICIPPTVEMRDLLMATDEELARNAAHWNARKSESIVPVAIQAFVKKWPCK